MSLPPRLVLVGAGHAHIEVLRQFGRNRPPADLHVLTEWPYLTYSGMVPGFIGEQYSIEALTIDLEPLLRRAGATLHLGSMAGLNASAQVLHTTSGDLHYDLASFNLGGVGTAPAGPADHPATAVRPIGHLLRDLPLVLDRVGSGRPLVIVGGGAAGVELACAFAVRSQPIAVTLIEARERILPTAPEGASASALAALASHGVQVLTGLAVEEVTTDGLVLSDGSQVEAGHVLWATPARSAGWFEGSGLEADADGFVQVSSALVARGAETCFAAGDCASIVGSSGLPRSGAVAVHQGPLLARNLRRVLERREPVEFRPRSSYLALLNLGRGSATGYRGDLHFTGSWVMRLKDAIDRRWVRRYR